MEETIRRDRKGMEICDIKKDTSVNQAQIDSNSLSSEEENKENAWCFNNEELTSKSSWENIKQKKDFGKGKI